MTNPNPLPLRIMILRYLAVTVLTALGVTVVYYALGALFSVPPPAGGGIVVAIVPALDAGTTFARHHKRVPTRAEAWRFSFILFAAHVVFGVALVALITATMAVAVFDPVLALLRSSFGVVAVAVIAAVYLLATRFFFGSGAKGELRRAARDASEDK